MQLIHDQPIYSVSQLNNEVKEILEGTYFNLMIEGEISNFSCPSSGHWYFSLKDENSQVRCAMFRMHNSKVTTFPEDGAHVLLKAKVSLYPHRGDFQLIVHHMEDVGEGVLQKRFEALKKLLLNEGLFDEIYKKPLPTYPKNIGVITSNTGAALQDILSVLKRRYPLARVTVYPTLVQGSQAAQNICQIIEAANQQPRCDVLILARGGGSLEDLWPFNEEQVARSIFASQLPIVTGIGHETDFTIADFVADVRAATPSAAAETVTPNISELQKHIDELHITLQKLMEQKLILLQQKADLLSQKLLRFHPKERLKAQHLKLEHMSNQLTQLMQNKLTLRKQYFIALVKQLHALSPLAILARGYAIAMKDGLAINSTRDLATGDNIHITLAHGEIDCEITHKF